MGWFYCDVFEFLFFEVVVDQWQKGIGVCVDYELDLIDGFSEWWNGILWFFWIIGDKGQDFKGVLVEYFFCIVQVWFVLLGIDFWVVWIGCYGYVGEGVVN